MAQGKGVRQLSYFDCPGGGQVVVVNDVAYIGHMNGPEGTSIVDVRDPYHPRRLAELRVPPGTQSHKVRVANDVMLINWEAPPPFHLPPGFRGGLGIYDVSRPDQPRELAFWPAGGAGVHRFDFDGRYAYISPEVEGYHGNIVMILDLGDPRRAEEVGRWWMPGQWVAGGETPSWPGRLHRCHHSLRLGNRLYVSYLHGGFVILDIEDPTKPRWIAGLDWSPPYPHMLHTALPIPFPVRGRRLLVAPDEDVLKLWPSPPAFLWLVDITDETRPMPIATFQVEGVDDSPQPEMTGCHQTAEQVVLGTEIPVAWFSYGLRIVDIANPHAPREVASFVPPVPPGANRVLSNDVCVDPRGLLYLVDRQRGLHILERVP
jgi:hypothetical protein